MAVVIISNLSYFLLGLVLAAIGFAKLWKNRSVGCPPGPFKWPIIGNLHLLRGHSVPYQAFDKLSAEYGQVFSMQLGSVPAVVVQGIDNIRQVLIQKGHHFDSRPNFNRYHQLFHGNKENCKFFFYLVESSSKTTYPYFSRQALAFCDWSDLQKKRRDMLKDHTFPKVYTNNYERLDNLISEEFERLVRGMKGKKEASTNDRKEELPKALRRLMENKHVETIIRFPHYFKSKSNVAPDTGIDMKRELSLAVGNIFLRYFCSTDLKDDPALGDFVRNFDEIFYEVNQGYAFDFLPFLGIFRGSHIKKIQKNSRDIREFVLGKVLGRRLEEMKRETPEKDYLDSLMKSVKFPRDGEVKIDLETALFSLEDIIGGHSAISNFLVKLMQYVANNKEVQKRIKEEADALGKDFITLRDRCHMPYTEAVVMETLRLLSSPIVPHVANQDTSIAGYAIKKDTLIFLNNYELNMSEDLWSEPGRFDPSRFLDPETGDKVKPGHFLPFGGGKRSCMGYKLVQFVSFVLVANIVNNFSFESSDKEEVSTGNLASPPARAYKFNFHVRAK